MTRAETKLYLVGKGSSKKLANKYSGKSENNHLPVTERESFMTFQDWLLAILEAYSKENLPIHTRFVTDQDLSPDKMGSLKNSRAFNPDDLSHNRQSEDIARALDMLEAVKRINQKYKAAIDLPTVRTPSQIKKFYEPVIETEGVDLMEETCHTKSNFELPDFKRTKTVVATAIGSSLHELMQRLSLSQKVSKADLLQALAAVQADDEVKSRLDLDKILSFFEDLSP